MILIGTSGFSYADWKGYFYPPTMSAKDMLAFYAQYFNTCEINSSYYRLPSPVHTAAMLRKSQGRVNFVLKLHQSMTQQRNAGTADYRLLTEAIKPLQAGEVLGALLAQFPYSFTNHLDTRGYVADLKQRLPDNVPLVVEFRHRSWMQDAVIDFLRGLGVGMVNVDEPDLKGLMPATSLVCGRIAYVRFHGRNREKWFKRNVQPWEGYDYLYSPEELQEWVGRIKQMDEQADVTYVFFNNHWQSQAVTNARQLAGMLGISEKGQK